MTHSPRRNTADIMARPSPLAPFCWCGRLLVPAGATLTTVAPQPGTPARRTKYAAGADFNSGGAGEVAVEVAQGFGTKLEAGRDFILYLSSQTWPNSVNFWFQKLIKRSPCSHNSPLSTSSDYEVQRDRKTRHIAQTA